MKRSAPQWSSVTVHRLHGTTLELHPASSDGWYVIDTANRTGPLTGALMLPLARLTAETLSARRCKTCNGLGGLIGEGDVGITCKRCRGTGRKLR